jgi:hypothetical protein
MLRHRLVAVVELPNGRNRELHRPSLFLLATRDLVREFD